MTTIYIYTSIQSLFHICRAFLRRDIAIPRVGLACQWALQAPRACREPQPQSNTLDHLKAYVAQVCYAENWTVGSCPFERFFKPMHGCLGWVVIFHREASSTHRGIFRDLIWTANWEGVWTFREWKHLLRMPTNWMRTFMRLAKTSTPKNTENTTPDKCGMFAFTCPQKGWQRMPKHPNIQQ